MSRIAKTQRRLPASVHGAAVYGRSTVTPGGAPWLASFVATHTEKFTMKRLRFAVAVAGIAALIGCTSMTPQQQGTVTGAAIGAAAGAGIAAIAGGSGWTGAAIGAVAGGVAGNIKGSRQQP